MPQPVSFAACAIASETGISSIRILRVDKSLFTTPYCLNFLFNQSLSAFVLLFLFNTLNNIPLSILILLFSLKIKGNTIFINRSFLFFELSILFISPGSIPTSNGLTMWFFLTILNLYSSSSNIWFKVDASILTVLGGPSLNSTSSYKYL